MKKTLKNIALTRALALGLTGCGINEPANIIEHNSQSANGYDVHLSFNDKDRMYPSIIKIGNLEDDSKHRFKEDEFLYGINRNKDFRFDELIFLGSEGSHLEDFASIKEINRIYNEVMSRQNKSQSNTNK